MHSHDKSDRQYGSQNKRRRRRAKIPDISYHEATGQPGDEDNVRAGYALLFEAALRARQNKIDGLSPDH